MSEGPQSDKVARDVLRRELRAIEVRMDELRGRRDEGQLADGWMARDNAVRRRSSPRITARDHDAVDALFHEAQRGLVICIGGGVLTASLSRTRSHAAPVETQAREPGALARPGDLTDDWTLHAATHQRVGGRDHRATGAALGHAIHI